MIVDVHFACQVAGKHQNGPPEIGRFSGRHPQKCILAPGAAFLAGREQDG